MDRVINRLREPSTWAGIAAFVAIFNQEVADYIPKLGEYVIMTGGVIAAIVAVVTRDKNGLHDVNY